MGYILLLRAINVGGRNRVVMAELKQQLADLGFTQVISYINSGNLIFNSTLDRHQTRHIIQNMFQDFYDFELPFALISVTDFRQEYENLPDWWFLDNFYRQNILFFLPAYFDTKPFELMEPAGERIHFGNLAVYWAVLDEMTYKRSSYVKITGDAFYKQVTIRNLNTLKKLYELSENY
ncbi:DUF1697 domain-containing protein [Aerococcaceae bacterium DSM 109653]|uniref:DUF1697 domain-containing protein n=1 Tax=Fundicoccus ignavus TaxID=2664442 RepID=A0A844C1Q1_9LACT|nr:DUF1697 domain-containing protein [Fundicoccus ignavus]MRI82636.1 DUF1697 domain-containing protein [Fundicoccus ignavus]